MSESRSERTRAGRGRGTPLPQPPKAPASLVPKLSLDEAFASAVDSPSTEESSFYDEAQASEIARKSGLSPQAPFVPLAQREQSLSSSGNRFATLSEEEQGGAESKEDEPAAPGADSPRSEPADKGSADARDGQLAALQAQMAEMAAMMMDLKSREADAALLDSRRVAAEAEAQKLREQLRKQQADANMVSNFASVAGIHSRVSTAATVPNEVAKYFKDNPLDCDAEFSPQMEDFKSKCLPGKAAIFHILCKENSWVAAMGDERQCREIDHAFASVLAQWPKDEAVRVELQQKCDSELPHVRKAWPIFLSAEIFDFLRKRMRLGNSAVTVARAFLAFQIHRFRDPGREQESYVNYRAFLRGEAKKIRSRLGGSMPSELQADEHWLRCIQIWARPVRGADRPIIQEYERVVFNAVEANMEFQYEQESAQKSPAPEDFPFPAFLSPDAVYKAISQVDSDMLAREQSSKKPKVPATAAAAQATAAKAAAAPAPAQGAKVHAVTSEKRKAAIQHPQYQVKVAGLSGKELGNVERQLGKEVLSGKVQSVAAPKAGAASAQAAAIADMQAVRLAELEQQMMAMRSAGDSAGGAQAPLQFEWMSCLICGSIEHGLRMRSLAEVRAEGKCPFLSKGISKAESMPRKAGKADPSKTYEACWQCHHYGHHGGNCFQKAWWGGMPPYAYSVEGARKRAEYEQRQAQKPPASGNVVDCFAQSLASAQVVQVPEPAAVLKAASPPAVEQQLSLHCASASCKRAIPSGVQCYSSKIGLLCGVCHVAGVNSEQFQVAVKEAAADSSFILFGLFFCFVVGVALVCDLVFCRSRRSRDGAASSMDISRQLEVPSAPPVPDDDSASDEEAAAGRMLRGPELMQSLSVKRAIALARRDQAQRKRALILQLEEQARVKRAAAVGRRAAQVASRSQQPVPVVAVPVSGQERVELPAGDARIAPFWPQGHVLPPSLEIVRWEAGPVQAPIRWRVPGGVAPPRVMIPFRARCGTEIVYGISHGRFRGCGCWRCPVHGGSCFFSWQSAPVFAVESWRLQ